MIGDVTGAGATAGASAATSGSSLGLLDGEAFLKLMVAQMRYQNPFQPSDPAAMLQQSAAFTQVETMQQMIAVQRELAGLTQVNVASGMVGREVTVAAADGTTMTGVVDGVRFTATGPVLSVNGLEVPLADATAIRAGAGAPTTGPAPVGGGADAGTDAGHGHDHA